MLNDGVSNMRNPATGGIQTVNATYNEANVTQATKLILHTGVTMRTVDEHGSINDVKVVSTDREIEFIGHNYGQIVLANGDVDYTLIPSCVVFEMTSDKPLDVKLTNSENNVTNIYKTKRFAYDSGIPVRVEVTYDIPADDPLAQAHVDYVSTQG